MLFRSVFIFIMYKAQYKVKINLEQNTIMIRDSFLKIKPIYINIDDITTIDIVKSRKSGRVYRLLVRCGENHFNRVVVLEPYEFLEQITKIKPNIVINEVFGSPV